jgi:membrane fusion protein (multidrug efflux system)
MNKRMVWMLVGCLIVFGGLFGVKWFGGKMMNQFFDNMPVPPATVSSAKVEAQNWRNGLSGVGSVVASQGTLVTTESAGIVAQVHFESGAEVKKGDLLVTLSAGSERADLQRLQSQAQLAETEFGRLKRLHDLDAISKSELDRAESDLQATRAAVAGQRERLAQKVIRAPFAGRLGIREINVGQYLNAGTPIVSLQALDPVYIDFSLPEQHIGAVQAGQIVTASVDAFQGREFSGVVAAIESQVDSSTRNFKVRANFANPDRALRPGLFARANITVGDEKQVLVVPLTSVSYNPYGNSVYVIQPSDDNKEVLVVRRRFIKTGEARGDLVSVVDGLKAGEEVATSGLLKLQNDSVVIINNSVMPNASLTPTPSDS